MPAIVHDMRRPAAWPGSLYVDASVLMGAFKAGMGRGTAAEAAAAAFVKALPGHCELWTSLLAIEETCWKALRRPLSAAARKRNLSVADLKRMYPLEYSAAYLVGRQRTAPLMAFLKTLGITLRGPRTPAGRDGQVRRAVCFLVRQMMHRYELEMADLFHIALAKLDGTSAIATLDAGYRDVDGIEVYTVS